MAAAWQFVSPALTSCSESVKAKAASASSEEGEEAVLNRLSLPAHVSESAKRRWKLAVADAQATADIQSLVREIDQQQFFNVVENAVVLNKTQMQNKMLAE